VTARGVPLSGPLAKQLYHPMKLWCDEGHHVDPRTFVCEGCALRVCSRHSRWTRPTPEDRARRLCDACTRKEDHRAHL
jgi:hypothetical protein